MSQDGPRDSAFSAHESAHEAASNPALAMKTEGSQINAGKPDLFSVDLDFGPAFDSAHNGAAEAYPNTDLKVPTERDDVRAIRVGELSFEVQQPDKAGEPPGINQAPWYYATFHTVTAVVGAGVLGLPYAFSYLGWAGGLIVLLLAGSTALYTSFLLATMHEQDGRRYNRYRDLGEAILGRKKMLMFIAPFQFVVMVGLGITYLLTGGQSLQHIDNLMTSGDKSAISLTSWIFIFALTQVALSQLRNFHSLWWVSVVGAAMSVLYSAIAAIACTARIGEHDVSFGQRESGADHAFGAMAAIGTVMFSYGGHSVLLEIQATLKAPPPPAETMMKGVKASYVVSALAYLTVALTGYAAFGKEVQPDVLISLRNPGWAIGLANFMVVLHVAASFQVFSMPVYEAVETAIQLRFPALNDRIAIVRGVWRAVYVNLAALVAASLPFFADLMGLIGAIGFIPMTMIMPVVLWLVAFPQRPLWERAINWSIIVVFTTLALVSFIGASWTIHRKASGYDFFA